MTNVGVALGGGGAKGLAHICMLEVIDELRIKPSCIVGTSIGAIVGVLYASGLSARTIRQEIEQGLIQSSDDLTEAVKTIFQWLQVVDINWNGDSLLNADAFLDDLMNHVGVDQFEQLDISFKAVAADFWRRSQVVFETGDIRTAIHASMALPGIFDPVVVDGRVLIDGGVVNPLPYNLLGPDCDFVIAVDVMGNRTESTGLVPSMAESVFNSFQIMQRTIVNQQIDREKPDIYIVPDIVDIQMLEFYKAGTIFEQVKPACDQLRAQLERYLLSADDS